MPNFNVATNIGPNLKRVQDQIAAAADRAGRKTEEITLIGVSKTFGAEAIRDAYALGLRDFGENRVQEWDSKRAGCEGLAARWHLIGHLQSNKARRAAQIFDTVDSVDSLGLAQKLSAAVADSTADSPADSAGRTLDVLIEVQLAPEESKSGVLEAEVPALAEGILALPGLRLRGLMAIPPFLERAEDVRKYFRKLRELRDSLRTRFGSGAGAAFSELSMGMSHDFEVAIEEGATQIRIGTAIFGARPPV
jgi:pyridoxal phosphate enzyme (YggS family)